MSHDPATWTFPARMTALDRQLVIDAATAATAPYVVITGDMFLGVARGYESQDAALAAVLTVCDAITPSVDAIPLIDDVIVWAAPYRPAGSSPLDVFAAAVRQALASQSEWAAVLKRKRKSLPDTAVQERQIATLSTAREQIVLPWLEELGWSATKWALQSGVNPSVTLDYLAGKSNPQRPYRNRLTGTLRKALKQPTLRLPK